MSIFFGDHASQRSHKESERYKDFDEETIKYDSGEFVQRAMQSPKAKETISSNYDKTVCVDSNPF